MQTKNLLSGICATFFVAFSLVGCSDYDNGYTEQQINFIRNFKEIYGEVDPTQDWNLAERANVTVTTTKPSQIKIYAKTNDAYKLVGDYKDVVGTRTLGFDVIEGTTEIMVSNGTSAAFTTVGESVSLGETRTVTPAGRDDRNNIVGVSVDAEYTKAAYDYVTAVMDIIPEDGNNLDIVTQDFYFVSQGPFKFYPIFWNTNSKNTLGVYWRDDNGDYHLQPVYTAKEGDELAEYKGIDEDDNEIYETDGVNADNASMLSGTIAAKGITLDIPEGTEFGFYLDVYNTNGVYYHTIYSQSDMNRVYSIVSAHGKTQNTLTGNQDPDRPEKTTWDGTNVAGTYDFGATFTTTVNGEKRKFFCFEDWDYAPGPDLNDMVFVFGTENVPVTVDNDAPKWIISAEDLGNALDIDYNDVVMEIEYVSGQNEAYVTPLAAGGTLASFVYFNDEPIGEIHKLMGDKTTTISGNYTPINVNSTRPTEEGEQIVIEVGPDFKVSLSKEVTNDEKDLVEVAQMGGFQVRVIPATMEATEENAKYHGQLIQNSGIESGDNTPFVICTPKIWTRDDTNVKGHYRWPMESVPMLPTDGYGTPAYNTEGHEFSEWVKNKDNCKDWYRYPNLDVTCAPSLPIEFDETTPVKKLDPEFTLTSDAELVLEAGKTYNVSDKIIYTVNREFFQDAKNVTITSDNEDVVKIIDANGWNPQIDAVGAGEATLTLHLEETDHYDEAYLKVKIIVERTDEGIFKLEGFDQWGNSTAVENYSVILLPNGTHEIALDRNNSPGLNIGVTYSSSNSSVATVSDNGVITANRGGEAVITVTSGITPVFNSKTATVNVKVPDLDAYGKPFSKIGALDNYSVSISTEELPKSGTVIVTYLIQKAAWNSVDGIKIQGLAAGQWEGVYETKDFTNNSELKQLFDDNDTYYVISIEISAEEYVNCPYLNLGNLNGPSVIDAYWKQK